MSTIIDGSNGGPTVEISALVGPDTVVEASPSPEDRTAS